MYATAERPLTFEEFLSWSDGSGRSFELIDGFPMPIQDPNAKHQNLMQRLCSTLDTFCIEENLPYVSRQSIQVRLQPNPLGREESRKADIVVFALEEWENLTHSSSSAAAYSPPPMVIEIVSSNWKDDYLTKCREYEDLGILEYWVVDYAGLGGTRFIGKPKQPTITVYTLLEGEYQPKQFRGDEEIESQTFKGLKLTAQQVFDMAKTR